MGIFNFHELGIGQRLLLFRDNLRLRSHFRVHFDVVFPLVRHIVLVENRFYRAFGNTRFTIDALLGMDVQHLLPFVKALDRANNYTIRVSAAYAWLGNNVRHDSIDLSTDNFNFQ